MSVNRTTSTQINTKLLLDNVETTFQFIHDHLIIFNFNSFFLKKKLLLLLFLGFVISITFL